MALPIEYRKLPDIINFACRYLPDGCSIQIELEQGAAVYTLLDPEGNEIRVPRQHECFYDDVREAVEHAVSCEAQFNKILETLATVQTSALERTSHGPSGSDAAIAAGHDGS